MGTLSVTDLNMGSSVKTLFYLVVLLSPVLVKAEEDPVIDEEQEAKQGDGGQGQMEMDWSQMLQMGMALGKGLLGEEAMEDLKKGDLSSLIQAGEKLFGEENVKNIFNAVNEGIFSTENETKDEDKTAESDDGLEDDEELVDEQQTNSEPSSEETSSQPQTESAEEKLSDEL